MSLELWKEIDGTISSEGYGILQLLPYEQVKFDKKKGKDQVYTLPVASRILINKQGRVYEIREHAAGGFEAIVDNPQETTHRRADSIKEILDYIAYKMR